MAVYIVWLRGINVGGKKLLMKDLKTHLEKEGYREVTTYIQSGNVVLSCKKTEPAKLAGQLSESISAMAGFDVTVLVHEPATLLRIRNASPFLKEKDIKTDRIFYTFLGSKPQQELVAKIKDLSFDPDRFTITDEAVHLYCPVSYGNSKLSNSFFENKLKLRASTRNLKTIDEMLRLAETLS